MSGTASLRLATRGSALALAQSTQVKEALERAHPGLEVVLKTVRTTGDLLQNTPPGAPDGKGIFIKEIEEALLRDEADFAVHSCKDLPVDMTPGLRTAAVPRRESAADVLICKPEVDPESWPVGAVVATGSLRRSCQWRERHAGAATEPVRGNIDTRVRKLRENAAWQGLILAEAGLNRLPLNLEGLQRRRLPYSWMLPAAGQGALLLQCREEDDRTFEQLRPLHDEGTFWAIRAERAILGELEVGCLYPVGALARPNGGSWIVEACWYPDPSGSALRCDLEPSQPDPEAAGRELAKKLKTLAGAGQ